MAKCLPNCPASVINLDVYGAHADPNGYIEVITEYGEAYIKASKLHEDLDEDFSEEFEIEKPNFVFNTNEEYLNHMAEACGRLDKFMA